MPNRLIDETSPYLLQHAHNPVDWYPWGSDALTRAQAEDMPILLSVGYSACHWCHVMERESFENVEIAAIMNENFVCIKVDREERPDIDSIYMTAVQAMTGHGGWPMTMFLTPDGKPFYGGTYFPPEDRGGMPAFPSVLRAISQAYREDRARIVENSEQLISQMRQASTSVRSLEPLTDQVFYQAFRGITGQFDDRNGGVGLQPKFPQPMTYEFLLRYHLRTEDADALDMVELTLSKMCRGGIYDQIGGGFHRYSTDDRWLVPHFEKMLYDNALLVRLYLHAFQVTGNSLYKRIVEETLAYVMREMTDHSGGFYSAQDADSEGVEGKFFVWRPEEIESVLGTETAELVNWYFGVTKIGNFEGLSILEATKSAKDIEREQLMSEEEFLRVIHEAREKLLNVRDSRVHPGLDDKILTAWNGLMLAAFAEAASVLDRQDYRDVATRNAEFLLTQLKAGPRLLRTYKDGKAKLNAYLEDYAFLIEGLLALHEATFDRRWLDEAIGLGRSMVDLFWDPKEAKFFDTGIDHEQLIVRPSDFADNAIPSGSSAATYALLRLAVITGDSEYESIAVSALRSVKDMMTRFPTSAGNWLATLDFYLSAVKEIAIVGDRADSRTSSLVSEVYRHFVPNRVFLGMNDEAMQGPEASDIPLLEGRKKVDEKPTAYVCQNYVCQLPVTKATDLARQLVD